MRFLMVTVLFVLTAFAAHISFLGQTNAEENESVSVQALAKHFLPDALVAAPKIVDCQLSGGTQTQCLSMTIRPQPVGIKIGPWCPRTISDGPDKAGIWLHEGRVYDADGTFIKNAASFFKDPNWKLYDPITGKIHVTDTETAC